MMCEPHDITARLLIPPIIKINAIGTINLLAAKECMLLLKQTVEIRLACFTTSFIRCNIFHLIFVLSLFKNKKQM